MKRAIIVMAVAATLTVGPAVYAQNYGGLSSLGAMAPTAFPTTTSSSGSLLSPSLPSAGIPRLTIPSAAIPRTAIPSTAIPRTAIPSTAIPRTAIPSTAIPRNVIPSAAIPRNAIPAFSLGQSSQSAASSGSGSSGYGNINCRFRRILGRRRIKRCINGSRSVCRRGRFSDGIRWRRPDTPVAANEAVGPGGCGVESRGASAVGMDGFLWFHPDAALTCRHFGISRQTFYRCQRRYDPLDLRSLEERSHCPQRRRQPTWSFSLRKKGFAFVRPERLNGRSGGVRCRLPTQIRHRESRHQANQLAHLSAQFRTANRSSTTRFGHIFYKRGNAVSGISAQQIQTTPLHWLPADIRSLPTHYANQIAVIVGP